MNRSVMEYKMIAEITVNELNSTIAAYIHDGWEPYGSPFCCVDEGVMVDICQAVVKYYPD